MRNWRKADDKKGQVTAEKMNESRIAENIISNMPLCLRQFKELRRE